MEGGGIKTCDPNSSGLKSLLIEWLRQIRVDQCLAKAEDMCASPSLLDQLEKLSKEAKFYS
jgi:hypothetical protein